MICNFSLKNLGATHTLYKNLIFSNIQIVCVCVGGGGVSQSIKFLISAFHGYRPSHNSCLHYNNTYKR